MTLEKIKVVLNSIVTWCGILIAVVPIVMAVLVEFANDQDWATPAVTWLAGAALTVLAIAKLIVTMIQRVSPALPRDFGLLPGSAAKGPGADRGDIGLVEVILLALAVAVVILLITVF